MDYGGFGAKVMILALDRLEFFSAVGYNLLGLGFNGGADFRILPQKRICPYFGAMYGYNAVIKVTGAQTFKHTYYGPSFNLGLEFWSVSKDNFFNLEVLFPARSSEYYKDLSYLKDIQNIKFLSEPTPIGISIGYHFSF